MTKRQELQRSSRVDHATASQTKTWIDRDSQAASSKTPDSTSDFESFSSSSPKAPARAFLWFARTGQTQKRRISSPTTALPKRIFCERYVNRILRNVIAIVRLAEAHGVQLKASVPSTTIMSRFLSIRVRSVVRVTVNVVIYLYSEVVMLAIRLPQSIEKRLEKLARRTGRTKTYYVREAILEHLEEIEDLYLAEGALERIRSGEERTIPLKQVMKRHGLQR